MARILVAGAGHGGVVCAYLLAKQGHSVILFEKSQRGETGPDQKDVIDKNTFEGTDITMPAIFTGIKNRLTLVSRGEESRPITLPEPSEEGILIERRAFIAFLLEKAESAGVDVIYNCTVFAPVMLGSRVAGLNTSAGIFYGDLIIDSCGVNSPVRDALPEYTRVNRAIEKYDVLYTYRAYFDKREGAPLPETLYDIILKDDGTTGFSWVVTEKDCVDVLIGRFFPVKPEDLKETLKDIKGDYPHIGDKLLRGGNVTPIPVCHPLGILVCDGYAAVGDSAFMTYAIKGSGISYSIKAGILLARAVEGDTLGQFNTETLWEYQRLFFKETGFGACRIALLKNVLPYFTADEIRELFNSDIFDAGDFNALMENKLEMVMGTQGRTMIKEKIRLIRENVILKEKLTALAMWIGKLTVTEAYFPNKYDKRDAEKWVEKYNEFFDSIRKKDEAASVI